MGGKRIGNEETTVSTVNQSEYLLYAIQCQINLKVLNNGTTIYMYCTMIFIIIT
jgi:hypothetical protein